MHGDERELKAAGEEAEHQQHIGAMTEGFGERMLEGLLFAAGDLAGRRDGGRRQRQRQRHHQQHQTGEHDQGRAASRNCRACATPNGANRNCPNDPAAVPAPSATPRHSGGNSFPNADSTRLNEQPDKPEADQNAGAEIERQRRRGIAHRDQARGIQQRADRDHPQGCRTGRRSRRRSAGRFPTADSGSPARGRTRRGPSEIRGSSAA